MWIATVATFGVAIAMRVHNAIHYTLLWGFDALYNWQYIRRLTVSWELPAPDAGWSMAHPPFFYYLGAAVVRLMQGASKDVEVVTLRLLVSAAGLAIAALAIALVRRLDPDDRPRAVLAGLLVLYLPVHIYMSAMVTEEVVAAALMSAVLVGAAFHLSASHERITWRHATWMGVVGGLALLTKLTGLLVLIAVAGAYLIDAWRRGALRPAVGPVAWMLVVGAAVGGWFYVRNLVGYGYLYPHGLEAHSIMFTMPPGERWVSDYLRIPLAIWTDPQVLNPDLLRSVWGSTYLTIWFDGHRVFLPRNTAAVTHAGTAILALAVIPTAACLAGVVRSFRRAIHERSGPDLALLLLVTLTLAGYVAFTWKNPWFVTNKGSFLLCLTVPYACYASEVLAEWLRRPGFFRAVVVTCGFALLVMIVGTFTFTELFWDMRHMHKPGVLW